MNNFFLIGTFFLLSCSNNPELVKEFIIEKNLPIEVIKQAYMIHTENEIIKVSIKAIKIERFLTPDARLVFSEGLNVHFFNDSSVLQSILTAERAVINEKNKIMQASSKVVLENTEGKKLQTEELFWDEKKELIFTEKKVTITTDKEVIYGEGLTSNPDFSVYTLKKVHGKINYLATENKN